MMQYLSTFRKINILAILLLLTGVAGVQQDASAAGRSRAELNKRVQRSHAEFSNRMYYMDTAIPVQLLAQAKAIVFVRQFKAGFVFGIKGGYAMSMLHDDKGNWSAPCFYSLGGGSVGLQFGGRQQDSIYLLMTREATRMLSGESSEVGLDFSAVAGPVGRNRDVSTLTESPVLVYTNEQGLYAGATVQAGMMSPSQVSNEIYYGVEGITALEILEGRVDMPVEAKPLAEELKKYTIEGIE